MKAIDLYKFIENYDVEYHWHNDDVLMFVDIRLIIYFYSILDNTIFDDDGITCTMKDGYIVFEMTAICEYYGIELKEVFDVTNE